MTHLCDPVSLAGVWHCNGTVQKLVHRWEDSLCLGRVPVNDQHLLQYTEQGGRMRGAKELDGEEEEEVVEEEEEEEKELEGGGMYIENMHTL